jgi:alkylation response protein AidB-like acyl-CoA dehydrogenase
MGALSAEERNELRDSARALLGRESSSARVRALLDDPLGHDPVLWRQMAELGWVGLLVPERFGGMGAGFGEVAVIAGELGRHLTASPFLAGAVLATSVLVLAGSDEQRARWLPGFADGTHLGTVALTGPTGRPDPELVGVTETPAGERIRLDGMAAFVPDAPVADVVFVAALAGETVSFFEVARDSPGVSVEPMASIDHTRRLASVSLDGVVVEGTARLPGGDVSDALLDRAVTVLAADGVGGATRVLELSVEYAKQRVQFGRPIGSFQAIKHKLADMFVRTQSASVAVEAAADALDDDPDSARRLTAIAGSSARDAFVSVAGDAVQTHGGIGFTWEHDCHLFLKRAQLDAAWFGDTAAHRERLAAAVLDAVRRTDAARHPEVPHQAEGALA